MSSIFASAKRRTQFTYGKSVRKRLSDYSPTVYKFDDDEDELSVPSGVERAITPGSKRVVRRKSMESKEVDQDTEMALDVDPHSSPVVSMVQSSRTRPNGKPKTKPEPLDTTVFDFPSSDEDILAAPTRPTPRRTNSARTKSTQVDAGVKDKPSGNGRRVRAGLPTTPAPEPASRTYRVTKPAPPTIVRSKSTRTGGHVAVEASGSTRSGSSSSDKPTRQGVLKTSGAMTSTPDKSRTTRSNSAQLEDAPDVEMGDIVFGEGPSGCKKATKRTYTRNEVQTTTMRRDLIVPRTPTTQVRPSLQQRSSCIASIDTKKTVIAEQRRTVVTTSANEPSRASSSFDTEPCAASETPKPPLESSQSAKVERTAKALPNITLPVQARQRESPASDTSSPGIKRSHMEFELDVTLDIPDPEATPRKRIVDRLKMNASMNSVEYYSDMSDSSDDDTMMADSSSQQSQIRTDSQFAAAISELTQNSQASQSSQTPQPETHRLLPLDRKDGALRRQRLGPKITYSRQRSFLTEDVQEDALLNQSLLPGALRALAVKEVEPEEEDLSSSDGEDSQGKAVKSVHELRETGLNQRYIDEVEGLLDDITVPSLSAKRSGYMDLARKMLDKAYVHKFAANGFDQKLLEAIGDVKDPIIGFAASFILIALLTHDPTSQTILEIRREPILQMLCSQLNNENDIKAIAKERKSNMSRAAISLIVELVGEISKSHSAIFSYPPKVVSPRLLAAKVLERLTHRIRLLDIKDEFLPTHATWALISLLAPFTDGSKADATYASADKNMLSIPVNFLRAYCASDMTFLSSSPDLHEIDALSSVYIHLKSRIARDDPKTFQVLKELLFVLTNRNSRAAERLAQSDLVSVLVNDISSGMKEIEKEVELEKRQSKADDVVQIIGTLCGLAQNSGGARDAVLLIRETHKRDDGDVDMDGSTSAGDGKTYLDVLVDIFNQYYSEEIFIVEKMSEIYIVIVLGYLSILLGTLAQHPKIRARLLVPTSSAASDNKETILKCLARVIEEFVRANEVMDKLFEIHPEMVNNDDGWKGGLNGEEGGKRLETYQELRARLLLWNGM